MNVPSSFKFSDCKLCPNRPTSDLCDLDGHASEDFEKIKWSVVYQPGQFVFYEGHAVLGLYIMCTGRAKLTRGTDRGQQRLIEIIEPGKLIEKHTFQDGAVHQSTCEVIEPSQICIVDRAQYLSLLKHNGDFAVKIIKLLSHEMGLSLNETDQFAFASARERVAGLLLELVDRYGEPVQNGVRISLQLKREELAQMAAMTVETVVRILNSFQSSQLILIKGRDITVLQPDRLARAAHRTITP
ncbi:MAG: Crp/Fnr family transcriptional regulator [Nitrospirales bacterium]|nr:Crp/Fnr family transcriptional regulator [Nitrospirales bacterium]